jgi:putative addiction module component (TIGR02574 family)
MQPTLQSLGIDRLSLDERLRLVEDIWDSIAAEAEALPIPQSHKDELDRRLAAYEQNPTAGSPVDEAMARLRKPLGVKP